jgi:hypothetical protein
MGSGNGNVSAAYADRIPHFQTNAGEKAVYEPVQIGSLQGRDFSHLDASIAPSAKMVAAVGFARLHDEQKTDSEKKVKVLQVSLEATPQAQLSIPSNRIQIVFEHPVTSFKKAVCWEQSASGAPRSSFWAMSEMMYIKSA